MFNLCIGILISNQINWAFKFLNHMKYLHLCIDYLIKLNVYGFNYKGAFNMFSKKYKQ